MQHDTNTTPEKTAPAFVSVPEQAAPRAPRRRGFRLRRRLRRAARPVALSGWSSF